MRLLAGVISLLIPGCGLILDLDPRDEAFAVDAASQDAGPDADVSNLDASFADASFDDGGLDANTDAGRDAGMEAGTPDSGFDAGTPDAGHDGGLPDANTDAGPPRILEFRYENTERPEGARSVWVSEDGAPWRSVACVGGIRRGAVTSCTHDVAPLPSSQRIRFYFDYDFGGIAPSCGATTCMGTYRAILDGRDLLVRMETAYDTPAAPGTPLQVQAFTTPP